MAKTFDLIFEYSVKYAKTMTAAEMQICAYLAANKGSSKKRKKKDKNKG